MKKGWIEKMTWFPKNRIHPNGYWRNEENFLKKAIKYNTKKELEKGFEILNENSIFYIFF